MMKFEKQIVKEIICSKPQTIVKPREFFMAWSGVLTLAYQGFTPTLLDVKKELVQKISGIKPENPGSKWPKTTLGVLRDGEKLSLDDLCLLRKICDKFNTEINKKKFVFNIDQLQVVVFQCRTIEKRLVTYQIDLNPNEFDDNDPPERHIEDVNETMKQFSDSRLKEYWSDVSRPGNRESHYRMPHIESTLIYDLPDSKDQPSYIEDFIKEPAQSSVLCNLIWR